MLVAIFNSQIQGVFNCSGHHVLGWRNIWDSAEHWSWVERSKGAGEIELCRVLNCILQVVSLHQVHWTAIQPAPAGWLQHIAGNREKSNLDSIHHLCQHCYTGSEDVMYKQFTSIGPFLSFFLSIWIWMTLYAGEELKGQLFIGDCHQEWFVFKTVRLNHHHISQVVCFLKFQQERSYGEKQYGAGGIIVEYLLTFSIFRRKQKLMYHSLESTSLKALLLMDSSPIIGCPCQ